MTRNIPWIWFAVLLMAVVLMLAGCGEPSRAERVQPPTNADNLSPTEVDLVAQTAPTEPPAETRRAIPVAEVGPRIDTGAIVPAPVGGPEATEPEAPGRQAPPEPEAEDVVRIPTDRFRAIPIERPAPVEEPSRESYEEIHLLVPAGTQLEIEILDPLSSQRNQIGDRFAARVVETVTVDGYFAIPVGSEIGGEVVDVKRLRKIGGQARLELRFDRLGTSSGAEVPIEASLFEEGRDETRRDAVVIGGAAVAGAVAGRAIKDKKKGKGGLVGTLLGAAVGAGIAAATEGESIEIPAGSRVLLVLEDDLQVTVRIRVIES